MFREIKENFSSMKTSKYILRMELAFWGCLILDTNISDTISSILNRGWMLFVFSFSEYQRQRRIQRSNP